MFISLTFTLIALFTREWIYYENSASLVGASTRSQAQFGLWEICLEQTQTTSSYTVGSPGLNATIRYNKCYGIKFSNFNNPECDFNPLTSNSWCVPCGGDDCGMCDRIRVCQAFLIIAAVFQIITICFAISEWAKWWKWPWSGCFAFMAFLFCMIGWAVYTAMWEQRCTAGIYGSGVAVDTTGRSLRCITDPSPSSCMKYGYSWALALVSWILNLFCVPWLLYVVMRRYERPDGTNTQNQLPSVISTSGYPPQPRPTSPRYQQSGSYSKPVDPADVQLADLSPRAQPYHVPTSPGAKGSVSYHSPAPAYPTYSHSDSVAQLGSYSTPMHPSFPSH